MARLLALLTLAVLLGACSDGGGGGGDGGGGGGTSGSGSIRADQATADQAMRDALDAVAGALGADAGGGTGSWAKCDLGRGVQYLANGQVRVPAPPDGGVAALTGALEKAGFTTEPRDEFHAQAMRDDLSIGLLLGHPPGGGPTVLTLTLESGCRHYSSDVEDSIADQPRTSYSPSP